MKPITRDWIKKEISVLLKQILGLLPMIRVLKLTYQILMHKKKRKVHNIREKRSTIILKIKGLRTDVVTLRWEKPPMIIKDLLQILKLKVSRTPLM